MPKKIPKEILPEDLLPFPQNINDITMKDDLPDDVIAYFELKSLKDISNMFNAVNSMVPDISITFYSDRVVIDGQYVAANGFIRVTLFACKFESYYYTIVDDGRDDDIGGGVDEHDDDTLSDDATFDSGDDYYSDDDSQPMHSEDDFRPIRSEDDSDGMSDDGTWDNDEAGAKYVTIWLRSDDIWRIFKQNKNVNDTLIFEVTDDNKLRVIISRWNGNEARYRLTINRGTIRVPMYDDIVFIKCLMFSLQTLHNILQDTAKFGDMIQVSIMNDECVMSSDPTSNFTVSTRLVNGSGEYFRVIQNDDESDNLYIMEKVAIFLAPKKCFASVKIVMIQLAIEPTRLMKLTYRIPSLGNIDIYVKNERV